MQKLTVTFIYGKDDTRKLKYRLTGDIPVGVMLEKLIGFQFIVDSADPKTFQILHKGVQIENLSKTFDECEILDGDELFLIPTVFDPIPPLPENDAPIKKTLTKSHERNSFSEEETETHSHSNSHHRPNQGRQGGRNSSHGNGNHRKSGQSPQSHPQKKQGEFNKPERKPAPAQTKSQAQNSPQGEKKDGPIPFKPHSRNYHRNHGRKPGAPNKSN